MPIRHLAAVTLSLAVALGATGCSGDEPRAVPATPGPTSTDPVIQPGLPGEPNATLSGRAAATAGPKATVAPGDVSFFQDMIVHHAQAIVMVETAMPRLTDTQVKAIASRIADEQDPEITYMAKWLTDRKQAVPPQATNPRLADHAHDGMPGMATAAQLTGLAKASGVAADRMFLTLMTAHHEGALDMVGTHGDVAGEEPVSEMAAEINVTQLKQIQQMQTMLQRLT